MDSEHKYTYEVVNIPGVRHLILVFKDGVFYSPRLNVKVSHSGSSPMKLAGQYMAIVEYLEERFGLDYVELDLYIDGDARAYSRVISLIRNQYDEHAIVLVDKLGNDLYNIKPFNEDNCYKG